HLLPMLLCIPFPGTVLVQEPDSPCGTYITCTHDEMEQRGATCANPQCCVNACAAKCTSLIECYQCCIGFYDQQSAYKKCRELCLEVWPQ
ncbi:MAG TPA: hypothetical protein PKC49_01735, partial [Phycisphaerae bacterium]|nr:hypothetical protein [Phycisphaerae bacterium]